MNQGVILKDLVLVGGGHAHVHVVKMFGMKPLPGVRVTVISRELDSPYSGMLPGFVAGLYTHDECHLDIRKITSFAHARFIHAEVCGIDTKRKLIKFTDPCRPPMSYDVVSINIGITPSLGSSAWAKDENCNLGVHITPVKPIDGFSRRWSAIVNRLRMIIETETNPPPFRVAMVGAGAGGVELCLAMYARLRKEVISSEVDPSFLHFTILNRGKTIMANHNKAVRKIMLRILHEKGILVKCNCEVVNVENSNGTHLLQCNNGEKIAFDEAVWCTQAAPQAWLKETGLSLDNDGFINVQNTLESTNTSDVFAAGDICCLVENPRLKAGVFAVRAGPPLVANLKSRLKGDNLLEEWVPQEQFLGIIGTGDSYAIASRGPLALEGEYLWTLKDHIDRIWMHGYQEFPVMDMTKKRKKKKDASIERTGSNHVIIEAEEDDESDDEKTEQLAHAMGQEAIDLLTHSKMRCGGCGSKVGAQILDRALTRVQHLINPRSEVVAGLGVSKGDDAALVRLPNKSNLLMVHTIDYFRSFISDPFIFGRIAANHSLSDIHAMNGDAITCLALCVIPFGPEIKVEESLVQMLAGMCSFLKEENCSLVGGHTSEGGDNAVGLAVNGVVEEGKELRKGPPKDGDSLILTKPLGTGAILAADMRASATGRWVQGALDNMQISNRAAAAILAQHNCSGCTDVTGFGLMGHLLEMMKHTLPSNENPDHSILLDDDVCKRNIDGVVCSVDIDLGCVPILDGAKQCVAAGIFSSLHPSNIRCARAVENPEDGKGSYAYPLLFDPQTAGGLLASVPSHVAADVIDALHAAGYKQAAVIGSFKQSSFSEPSIRIC